jgi:hypothetical protein
MPKITIDRDQAYFWTRRWQEGECQAEEDLRAGRVCDFETMDDLLRDLDAGSGSTIALNDSNAPFTP